MIQYDESVCRDLDAGSHREWLETNGLGGYASSTVSGMNTRRYHGLLVSATHPPVGRMVLLSKIEETLIVGGKRYDLSVNRYPGAVHPQGYSYLKQFRIDPFPVYLYEVDGVQLQKRVCMVDGPGGELLPGTTSSDRIPGLSLHFARKRSAQSSIGNRTRQRPY
jgi:glycogen debranching enzyme